MISIAHHPKVQAAIDQWRLGLPVVPQVDESTITKEHLRALIQILIETLENELQQKEQTT